MNLFVSKLKSIKNKFAQARQEKILNQHILIRNLANKREFQEVITRYEKNQIVQYQDLLDVIAYCYFQNLRYQKATKLFDLYLSKNSKNYYANYFNALCKFQLEELDEAALLFLKSFNLANSEHNLILDHLLPLIQEFTDKDLTCKIYQGLLSTIDEKSLDLNILARVYFSKKDDQKLLDLRIKDVDVYYIKDAHEISRTTGASIQKFPNEKIRYINFKNKDNLWIDKKEDIWVSSPELYNIELKNVKINSGSSFILSDSGFVLSETLAHQEFGKYVETKRDPTVIGRRDDALLIKSYSLQEENVSRAFMLAGCATDAYGHWFAEHLPKLRFFQKHPDYNITPIIVDSNMPESHYDFLKILSDRPLIKLEKSKSLYIESLIVSSTDTFFPVDLVAHHKVPLEHQSGITTSALNYFKKLVEEKFPPAPSKALRRLFFSRKHLQWRRVINENEITEMLSQYGFEVIKIEDYNFVEQVRIFQQAEIIVAPNGSATNNLVFSPETCKTLLLGQTGIYNWGTWFGSFKEIGHDISYMSGETIGASEGKHLDYKICVKSLEKLVKQILAH